jgi:nucleotide-binding universal stress UspA family protein
MSSRNPHRIKNTILIAIFLAGMIIGIFLELFFPLFDLGNIYGEFGFWGLIGRAGLVLFILTIPVGYFLWLVMGIFQISRVKEPEEAVRKKPLHLDVKQINRILIPIGDGPNALLGLQLMSQLTTLNKDGKITLLRIIPPSMKTDVDEQREIVRKLAHESLLDTQRDFEVEVKIRVSNDVIKPTVALAKEGQYDLLVVGASERSQVGKILFGSIALSLAEQAPCPVIIVRRNIKSEAMA